MSSRYTIGEEVSGSEQQTERFEVAEEPELRATVEMEVQAKVDTNHPDARRAGMTLEAEERMAGREMEIERTSRRVELSLENDREARTRRVAARGSRQRRCAFDERAASVEPECEPGLDDPRARLSKQELAGVNQEADRLARGLGGWKRPAYAKRLAEHVVEGASLLTASLRVVEQVKTGPGLVVPIAKIGEVPSREVSVSGRVKALWTPSSPTIAQVGLLEDETGTTKLTVWKRSDSPWLAEGERIRVYKAAKSWYGGRVHIAATGWTEMAFPDREAWWAE
ncbi:DNA-binding protein [Salinirubellus salinus]|uniref:DNA-binding protein n=1 Tax=Salinirubellus salinus TaxID=1364945 RepID=A0A9E7R6I4_9EURY|nr:DNA-binding protein [Salinirubellus salinus]UWM56825.1 DNA-binding protein [Salinirubellus salinus]